MPALTYKAYLETEVSLPIHAHLLLDDGDGALLLESLTADGDLNALRTQPHTSKLYCAVLAPQVDVIAVVTVDTIIGDVFPQTIEYTLVSGDDTLIRSGMTAWVGTAAHDDSLGRVRARATPGAGFLYLAENSDIDWSVGTYITFYNEYLPWPRYPYVQPDGTIFKDYAINYFTPPNSQTVLWPPVAMMGSCGVGIMHGGVAYVLFDGGESYATAPGAVIDTFAWVFPDGTPATDTNQAPGWVAFSTQGVKQVQLTVTDTNGIATISRRAILIVDLDAPLYPYYAYTDFGVEGWEGDTDTGWGTKLRVFGTSDRTYFSERAVVMLYAEETYGGEAAGDTSTAALAGGTFASNSSGAAGAVVWSNPSNAATLNQVYATAVLGVGGVSNWLLITNCGFAIPTQGSIRGVRVRVTGKANNTFRVSDAFIQLFVAGAAVGSNKATLAFLPATDTAWEYGGENDLWGLTLVPAVVNLTTFGVGLIYTGGTPDAAVSVDYVDITVYYNTGATLGFETYRSNVKHMGYILDDSVTVDPQTNEVSFETGSISRVAEKLYGFPTIVQDKAEPATWSEGYALTMRRATLYLLYWHTTFMQIADVLIEDDSTPVQIADFPKSSLWDMLRNWIASTRIGHAYVTKNGRVTVARDAQIMTLAERNALDIVMQLQSNDWREEVEISESVLSVLAFLDWSGVWYEGNPDVAPIPLFSKAPGDAPKVYGRDEAVQYLVLTGQPDSNVLAGLYLAWKNGGDTVRISMAGNWVSAFDPGYVEYVQAPVGGFVTKRGTLLADARLIVRSMSIDADTANGVLLPTLVLEAESTTLHNQGETGDYPPGAIPAQAAACPLGMSWDAEARECVITYPSDNPYPWQDTWRSSVYVATNTLGVFFSDNFTGPDGAMPTWKSVNKGLSTSGALSCWQMVSDPYNPSLLYYITANNGTNSVLYKWDVAAQEWNALHDAKTLAAAIGIPSGGVLLDVCYITTLMVSPSRPAGYLAIIITNADAPNYTTWFSESSDYGANFSTAVKIDVSGGASWAQGMQQRGTMGQFAGASGDPAGDVLYIPLQKRLGVGTSKMWESTDSGATFTAPGYTNPTYDFEAGTLVVDPSSQDVAWYAQDAIKVFTGTMGAVATKLAGVGSAYKNALDVFLNPASAPATIVRVYDALDAGNRRRMYKTVDGGGAWTSQDDAGTDMTDAGYPFGVLVLSDADDKCYVMASASPGVGGHHIGVSDDDGANITGKSGSAAGIADPGDGTGIPYSSGGIVDIAVVWNTK